MNSGTNRVTFSLAPAGVFFYSFLIQTRKSGIAAVRTETFPSNAQRDSIDAHGNLTTTTTVADRAIPTGNGVRPAPSQASSFPASASQLCWCPRWKRSQ